MLRRNTRNSGGASLGLPTTSGGGGGNRKSFFSRLGGKQKNDGSAASIRLENPMAKQWRTSDMGTKVSYVLTLVFLLCMILGYQVLRYNSASVWFTCNLLDCYVQVTPRGRRKTISLTIARSQLVKVEMVAVTNDGIYVNSSPNLKDEKRYDNRGGNSKKKYSGKTGSFKGPDADGNYVSYALYLQDDTTEAYQKTRGLNNNNENNENNNDNNANNNNEKLPNTDLTSIKQFMEVVSDNGTYRLGMRQFRMTQSRRRIRTMISKIESYLKYRRQKLVMKENKSPSVLAILLMVGGLLGFLLTLLIGSFWEEDRVYEQERQKRLAQKSKSKGSSSNKYRPSQSSSSTSTYNASVGKRMSSSTSSSRQMPPRYEVRTSATRRANSKFS